MGSGGKAGKGRQKGFFSVPVLFTSEMQPPINVQGIPEWPASLLHLVDGEMNQSKAVSSLVCIQDSLPCSRAVGTSALMNLSSRIVDTEGFWQHGASLKHDSKKTPQNTPQGHDSSSYMDSCSDPLTLLPTMSAHQVSLSICVLMASFHPHL